MTTAEEYIGRVLGLMPPATPLREQIAAELRAHIAERIAHGYELEEILRQLGDPVALADSYLEANPLVPASLRDRLLAKLIDSLLVLAVVGALIAAWWLIDGPIVPALATIVLVLAFCGAWLLGVYTAVSEYSSGQTFGKRARELCVVHESGRRITLGQAVVRQLPIVFSVIWVDALFILFTDKRQRAFELLSKTRVVQASPREEP